MTNNTHKSSKVAQALNREYFYLYPDEAAQQLNNLPPNNILDLLQTEPAFAVVTVFERLNPDIASEIIKEMEDEFFQKLYTSINPALGAILLSRLDNDIVEKRLAVLPSKLAQELQELMSYPSDSAGSLMDPRVTTFSEEDTVEKALVRIRKLKERRIFDVCIIDRESNLKGVVPLQVLAVSQPQAKLSELVSGKPICVQAFASREEVVQIIEERKLASLPVIDQDNKLLGIIRYDALVNAAKQQATEDLQVMFGAGRDERALSKVTFAIRKRLPWLEINLATAFLAAAVVGLFEDTIARITALAIFLPVVAGQSGNTGSQALAVTMRGLALREVRVRHWLQIMRKEVLVGFINGCTIAFTTFIIAFLWMHNIGLAIVIGIAMIFSMVIAGLSGALIPMILKTFGQDPAQSSSIVLTTVTDVVGFMSFLGLAKLMAGVLNIA